MSQITLIRHGQANTQARDEHSYDQLSDLGHQQAAWLGNHFNANKQHFSRVYCGTMQRHIETAQGAQAQRYGEVIQDPRLNEFPYFDLSKAMERQFKLEVPNSREGFAAHIPKVLGAWEQDLLTDIPETYTTFSNRIGEAIDEILSGDGPALVFSSGGVISEIMRQSLNLDTSGWARMCLAIMNTSIHQLHMLLDKPLMTQFNAVPHLEAPDRLFAQTHL